MNWITIIGLLAATVTTISFLPQVIKSLKTRETRAISLATYNRPRAMVALWILN